MGAMVAHALEHGYNHVEVSQEAEDEWVESILAAPPRVGMAGCTPGYCKTAVVSRLVALSVSLTWNASILSRR